MSCKHVTRKEGWRLAIASEKLTRNERQEIKALEPWADCISFETKSPMVWSEEQQEMVVGSVKTTFIYFEYPLPSACVDELVDEINQYLAS